MIPRGIAKRYSTALFNAAVDMNAVDDVSNDTAAFRKLLLENPSLRGFLLSPQVLTKEKKSVLENSLKGRATDLFVEFLVLLIDKKRFPHVEEIMDGYGHLYEQHKGIIEIRAITAIPLEESLREKTIRILGERLGKKIRLTEKVDPEIIGGMILILEDKIMDGSVRYDLQKLKRELDEIRV